MPSYRQLADLLRARIETGDLAPGDLIPSETSLVQDTGLARGTVRRAMQVLRDEGAIVTIPGRGSFVAPK